MTSSKKAVGTQATSSEQNRTQRILFPRHRLADGWPLATCLLMAAIASSEAVGLVWTPALAGPTSPFVTAAATLSSCTSEGAADGKIRLPLAASVLFVATAPSAVVGLALWWTRLCLSRMAGSGRRRWGAPPRPSLPSRPWWPTACRRAGHA